MVFFYLGILSLSSSLKRLVFNIHWAHQRAFQSFIWSNEI